MHPTYEALREVTWHMVLGSMVYTERTETAAISCGTSHVKAKQRCKYAILVDIQKAL